MKEEVGRSDIHLNEKFRISKHLPSRASLQILRAAVNHDVIVQ